MQYKWVVLSNTTVGTLMASLDTNIVLIALPTIAHQLPDTSVFVLLWILIGYALLTSVVLLNFGRLGDMFGRVRLYVLGFAIFTAGSALCGFSQTGPELVVFRMVQATGAGFLFANAAAIITDAFAPNERGRALGINQVSIVAGAVTGLVLGGILTSLLGWRSIFFVNVPIGAIATWRAYTGLRELHRPQKEHRIDWLGNISFAAGLTAILLSVTLYALGQLATASFVGLLMGGVGSLVLFLWIEQRVTHPMFDLSLLRIRLFSASIGAIFLNALARGAFSFVMVFFLQGPPHYLSPLTAGLYLVPVSASLAVIGPISGALSDRYGSRPFAVLGLLVSAAGFVWLTQIGPATTFFDLVGPFVLVGLGMGLFASPNRAAMMSSVPPDRRGVAAGIGTTLINSGVTLSLGFAILVMANALPLGSLTAIFLGTASGNPGAVAVGRFIDATHLVFELSAILLLIALVPAAMRGPEERTLARGSSELPVDGA
ncbi:MAG: MFS transporter [Thermoplasmata archaeon]|nr:MFS transporter [Thermoplasmata archaeon]